MKRNELVIVPSPGKSHLAPSVEFAYALLRRDDRFSVTFLVINSPFDPSPLSLPPTSHPHMQFLLVPKPLQLPSLELMKESFPNYMTLYIKSHLPQIKDIIANRFSTASSHRLSGLVVDMFCTSIVDLAIDLGVPSYLFFTSGAAALGMLIYLYSRSKLDGAVAGADSDPEIHHMPSYVNPVPTNVLPDFALNNKQRKLGSQDEYIKKTKGIIINSILELETHAVSSLSDGTIPFPPVYTIGPLLDFKGNTNDKGSDHEQIMKWLDDQPPKSVVFLCFGNYGAFSTAQLKEIATGLERSGQRFLWSVRKAQPGKVSPVDYENVDEVLPQGFSERTKEMGRVCGWAPQVEVLAHPATGGFVSHCGWNSVLESLWFGVPIGTWPMYAEQQMNAFQLVRDLGLAVELRLDFRKDGGDVVLSGEIERAVRCLMDGGEDGEGGSVRKRVREMSEKCRRAVSEGGSSYHSFGCFIEAVLANVET
ncbi:anthocyanidin 3-O-glucosyltransferase 2-like [Humulus lupulus]|uniref:anthocyanidin 3-O-glucosyltransferase 2-like n=1 Tax=Humulus lupulus TaxID=3486 RepID=UPI002B416D27|nr:anthocyanidin 3-O-glucosyltransferase 2-like [Humulus lupulus]